MKSAASKPPKSISRLLPPVLLVAVMIGVPGLYAVAQQRDGLEVQRGRQEKLEKRGNQTYYEAHWNLDDLPTYQPEQQVSGTIRQWGSNYFSDSPLNKYWEEGFKKLHPGVTFADDEKTTLAAIPSLAFGLADLAPSRHITFDETLFFQRYKSRSPVEITAVTGSLNVPGWNYALGIYVNKDNPLTKLSIEQLDGIFGAQRDGGYDGTTWRTDIARGPDKNIRTWGQLGLGGEWADKPIDVYGYNLRYHIPRTFERVVFQGGDKWNEQMHEFANYKNADGTTELEGKQTLDAVARDRYGIAYSSMAFSNERTKMLPLAARGSSDYVPLNLETVRARTYPLIDEVYFYLDREPGKPIDPKVREFLRYILSREGQQAVQRDGKFMPLTAATVREQLKKLD